MRVWMCVHKFCHFEKGTFVAKTMEKHRRKKWESE